MFEWGGDSVIGWRWESVDTVPEVRAAQLITSGDSTTITGAMSSFPLGEWSEPAQCWNDPTRTSLRHEDAPIEGCVCGYRICRNIETARAYMFYGNKPFYDTNMAALVLVRVEGTKAIANDFTRNLTPWNCVSANRIRPLWPAYVTHEPTAELIREHYNTDDVRCIESWSELMARV